MEFLDYYHVNDRRTHRRFAVAISARLYHANGHFSLCSTADLSLAGASIYLISARHEPVTAFACDETGKVGVTKFTFAQPFVRLMFDSKSETRTILKRALRSLAERNMIQPLPSRRGERLFTRNVLLTRDDGSHLICDIVDMSSNGMLLNADVRPSLGERVMMGRISGHVVRHHGTGFAIRIKEHATGNNIVRFHLPYRNPVDTPSSTFEDLV